MKNLSRPTLCRAAFRIFCIFDVRSIVLKNLIVFPQKTFYCVSSITATFKDSYAEQRPQLFGMHPFPSKNHVVRIELGCFVDYCMTHRAKQDKVLECASFFFTQRCLGSRPLIVRSEYMRHFRNMKALTGEVYEKFPRATRILAVTAGRRE